MPSAYKPNGYPASHAWSLGRIKPPSKSSADVRIFICSNWIFSFVAFFFSFLALIREQKMYTVLSTVGIIDCVWSFGELLRNKCNFNRGIFSRNRSRMLCLILCLWHRRRLFCQLGNKAVRPCHVLICVSRMCLDWVRRMFWHWVMRMFG